MEYSNEEYADMHLMYGRALCNASAARRFYQHSYPNRRIPDRKTFELIDQRLRETGQFAPVTASRGAPRTARTVEVEENILDEVAAHPTVSIRSLSSFTNVPKTTVARILREQLLHFYHIQKVYALNPDVFRARVQFSQWFLQRHEQNPMLTRLILYTDEASFGRNGVINYHNLHYWSDENPHAIIETKHQRQFYVNVWSGIIGPYLLGPFVLPPRLNGQSYLDFLVHQLPQLLEDVDLETRNALIFMHDGAPPHFSAAVSDHLNEVYPNRWIGRGGPIHWPARTPDMNPLDFFLWGHLKNLVYSTPVTTREELEERIFYCANEIRQNPEMLWREQQSSVKRARIFIREGGTNIENLL